jgi:uncharacterized protein YaeQ
VALNATVHAFEVELAHVDRGVYASLAFRMARHPSESAEYLATRLLAYCLEYTDGIAFSKGGVSDPDEPPIAVRDPTGALLAWIDIGVPDADRLHRAAKAAPRVAVYTHKDPARLARLLDGVRIHRREALEIYSVDRTLVADLAAALARRMAIELSVHDGHVIVTTGDATLTGAVERIALGD